MFENFAIILGSAVLSIFGGTTPTDCDEESAMYNNLSGIMFQVFAVPTGNEYLNYMHGEIIAISPFAQELSEPFNSEFNRLESDYLEYKADPNSGKAQVLWNELVAMTEKEEVFKNFNANKAMTKCLERFRQQIAFDLKKFTNETLWQLMGQVEVMSEFITEIDENLKEQFEKDFDLFSDFFDFFLDQPNDLTQKQMLDYIDTLITDLESGTIS
jgi:hypothetical protein